MLNRKRIIVIKKRGLFRMRHLFLAATAIGLLMLAACAPKEPGVFPGKKPGAELMQSAEAAFDAERYNEAFRLYQTYVQRYPDSPMLPAALLKMGLARSRQGKYAQAVAYLEQAMNNYPQSRYARDAAVERLVVLYEAGDYEKVALRASDAFSYRLSDTQFVRAAVHAGDAYMALNLGRAAYLAFLKAYQRAAPVRKEADIRPRIKAAIRLLSAEQLQEALEKLHARFPAGYLLYQLGCRLEASGRFDDAIAVFSDFLDRYPAHELSETAGRQIEALKAIGYGAEIRIGCLLPLSGRYATFGERALNGIELAVSHSDRGKTDEGLPVQLMVADTASDTEKAADAVRTLGEQGVAVIIGPLATAKSAAGAAQEAGIPILTLSQAKGIPGVGDYVFRNFITPEMQVKALVDYAAEAMAMDRFAVLYPDEPYGRTFMNLFWDVLLAHNASVVGLEKYDPSHTDFSEAIKKLVGLYYEIPEDIAEEEQGGLVASKASSSDQLEAGGEETQPEPIVDFEAVFIPDSPEKAGLMLPQLAYYDVNNIYCLGTNLWYSDRLIHMSRRHAQGAIFPVGFFAESSAELVERFVSEFESVYERKPRFIEAIGYDTARMVITCMRRSRYLGRRYIREQFTRMPPYNGVTGRTRFDQNGEAVKELCLLKVAGDGFVEVSGFKPSL